MEGFITDPALAQLTASAVIVWLYQKLKEASWFPALSDSTSLFVQRALAVVLAFATALGISYSFDAEAGNFVVTGLTFSGAVAAGWAALQAFVTQQLVYHGVFKPAPPVASGAIIDQPKLAVKP